MTIVGISTFAPVQTGVRGSDRGATRMSCSSPVIALHHGHGFFDHPTIEEMDRTPCV